ncbi:MAG TPA: MauE/DoxX family redox-associated membrane protein [Pirellulaceae bacterium]|nr:MauE/DoxX family redox-associated membrane protein [Pirellulaceae bacterium]
MNKEKGQPIISDPVRWCLAGILVFAAVGHLQNPHLVLNDVLNYRIVSGRVAVWVAMLLPFCELALAAILCARVPPTVGFGMATVLFGVFAASQWIAWFRELPIDCGCFGGFVRRQIGPASLVLVNAMFLVSVVGAITGCIISNREKVVRGYH